MEKPGDESQKLYGAKKIAYTSLLKAEAVNHCAPYFSAEDQANTFGSGLASAGPLGVWGI